MYKSIREFYNSKEWKVCRDTYRAYRKGLCERCLAKGIIKAGDEVHHKRRLTVNNINSPEIATNFKNLELLCSDCHQSEHRPDRQRMFRKSPRRYTVDTKTGRVDPLQTEEDPTP